MSDGALGFVLGTTAFPPAIRDDVVARYSGRYCKNLVQNRYLGAALVPLARKVTSLSAEEAGYLAWLHRCPEILDALLSSREKRSNVLEGIIENWRLSDDDQLRLINRHISVTVAWAIDDKIGIIPEVRVKLAEVLERRMPTSRARTDTWLEVSEPRSLLQAGFGGVVFEWPDGGGAAVAQHEAALDHDVDHWPVETVTSRRLGGLSARLVADFGDGVREESRAAWLAFLEMVGGTGGGTLVDVISCSLVLARSCVQTA